MGNIAIECQQSDFILMKLLNITEEYLFSSYPPFFVKYFDLSLKKRKGTSWTDAKL